MAGISRAFQVLGWALVALAAFVLGGTALLGDAASGLFIISFPSAVLGLGCLVIARTLRVSDAGVFQISAAGRSLYISATWWARPLLVLACLALALAVGLAIFGVVLVETSRDPYAGEAFGWLMVLYVSPLGALGLVLGLLAFVQARSGTPTKLPIGRNILLLLGGGAFFVAFVALLSGAPVPALIATGIAILCPVAVWRDVRRAESAADTALPSTSKDDLT